MLTSKMQKGLIFFFSPMKKTSGGLGPPATLLPPQAQEGRVTASSGCPSVRDSLTALWCCCCCRRAKHTPPHPTPTVSDSLESVSRSASHVRCRVTAHLTATGSSSLKSARRRTGGKSAASAVTAPSQNCRYLQAVVIGCLAQANQLYTNTKVVGAAKRVYQLVLGCDSFSSPSTTSGFRM